MDTALQKTIERLKQATNILVTVSKNPSVDQLAACVGLTLLLNKLDKHATAVFSGETPSTLEFLEVEKTLEKNTDSLRDFIISLDKSKADKLRYKVEDTVVKIFITPYRTSISDQDLIFSQGDLNVEVVMALGVHEREELDEAIVSHGRILHDATVICVNTQHPGELGSINWVDSKASSLSEMLVQLASVLKESALDGQIANALLTGIVAETDRFSNEKTSSGTMSASAKLIAAGANQQLVATKLEAAMQLTGTAVEAMRDGADQPAAEADSAVEAMAEDGSLKVNHNGEGEPPKAAAPPEASPAEQPAAGEESPPEAKNPDEENNGTNTGSGFITTPPTMGGTLTANGQRGDFDVTDPLSTENSKQPLLSRKRKKAPAEEPVTSQPEAAEGEKPGEPVADRPAAAESRTHTDTLADLERSIGSPHATALPEANTPGADNPPDAEEARGAVHEAIASHDPPALPPIEALNAQDFGLEITHDDTPPAEEPPVPPKPEAAPADPDYGNIHIDPQTGEIMFNHDQQPDALKPSVPQQDLSLPEVSNPNAPPPVPPPMMPPFTPPNDQNQG